MCTFTRTHTHTHVTHTQTHTHTHTQAHAHTPTPTHSHTHTHTHTGIEPPKESMERSFILVAEMDFEKFSKRWFEVKIHHPSSYTDREGEQSTLSGFGISPSSMSPFPTSFQAGRNSNAYYMHFEGKEGLEGERFMFSLTSERYQFNPVTSEEYLI